LNNFFPGKKKGNTQQIFVYHLFSKVISQFEYLIDLHTASFGRINSLYIRSDMNDIINRRLAELMNPEIILHSLTTKTLRGAATKIGIKGIHQTNEKVVINYKRRNNSRNRKSVDISKGFYQHCK
jgi:predicted deacylase